VAPPPVVVTGLGPSRPSWHRAAPGRPNRGLARSL